MKKLHRKTKIYDEGSPTTFENKYGWEATNTTCNTKASD